MKHLLNFLDNIDRPIKIEIGKLIIQNYSLKSNETTYFEGVIYCKPIHFKPLLNLGVKIDFSNKKVGFAWDQNTIGAGSNNCAVNVKMNLETFKKVSSYFRKDFQMDLKNDHDLKLLNFPFTPKKITVTNGVIYSSEKTKELIQVIRRKANLGFVYGYSRKTYNLIIVQKAINKKTV